MCSRTLICAATILFWIDAPAPFAAAATYFVAPHGDDSRAGTESQPWKTLRKAAAAVQPGDTVRIKAGDYFVGPTWIVNRAGTAESPITYRAFGDGEVRITGSSLLPPEKWTRVKGSIYSTPINQPVMAVFRSDIIAWGQGGNRIFNNVFFGEGKRGGISLNSIDNLVCHNTFVGSAYAVAFHQGKAGNRVLNNIVQDAAKSFLVWPAKALPQTLDSNLYHNATKTARWERDGVAYRVFADYQQAAGETHSRYADPKLAGPADAHLQPGSPAIDAGAADEVVVDIEGVARPQGTACDIGAYELKVNTK